MRLTLPTRVPMRPVLVFALVLLLVEVAEGTRLLLALAAQAFLIVAALAFNIAGGLAYPSGACIFFNAVLCLGIGAVVKACVGEPLQSNLLAPERTLAAYLAGMVSILVAVYLSTKLRRRRGLLEQVQAGERVDQIGVGCLLLAIVTPYLLPVSVQGTIAQFNSAFVYLAIILPVYHRVRQSGGRRIFHPIAFAGWAYLTYSYGLQSFSKQGLFAPTVAWVVASVAAGYRTTLARLVLFASVVSVAVAVLTPFSQLARNSRGETNQGEVALQLLLHPLQTRALYNESQRLTYMFGVEYHWFDQPQGLFDRLTMVPIDDALVYNTDHVRPGSPVALWTYVLNIVPRYLYPSKPTLLWGNVYAHEIGLIGTDDVTTGISFSPYADGYHTAGWLGVTLYLGLFFFAMFLVCDSVSGSIQRSQWGLVYLLFFSHNASEGMLGMTTYAISTATAALVAAALVSTYIAPIVGSLVLFRPSVPREVYPAPYNRQST